MNKAEFEEQVYDRLQTLNFEMITAGLTLEQLLATYDDTANMRVTADSVNMLLPQPADAENPASYSPQAKATYGGMILGLMLMQDILDIPEFEEVEDKLHERLVVPRLPQRIIGGHPEFVSTNVQVLNDIDLMPELVPSGQAALAHQMERYAQAGFGYIISAAMEKLVEKEDL